MENNGFIFVNLLPYREKQKALKIKQFSAIMLAFSVLGAGLIGVGHFSLSFKLDNQQSRNSFIEEENKKLDNTIKSISNLKEEIKLTLAKRKVVEGLQTNRADGVNVINEIANNLPDDTNLKSINKNGDKLIIIGQTSSNNKVSNYMTALEQSPVFVNPVLFEIKQVVLVNPNKKVKGVPDQTVNEFNITVEMQKSEEELKRIAEEQKQASKESNEKKAKK